MNRKERRLYERLQSKKNKRKIDWKKVIKSFKGLLLICFIFALFIFSFYVVNKNNSIRETVSEKPQTTTARVIYISGSKIYSANYEYMVNGKKYKNSTFHSYKGNAGDDICIEYNSSNPNFSIYCNEKEIESVKENVIYFTAKLYGLMFLGSVLLIIFQLIFGNRKLMSEITSKK